MEGWHSTAKGQEGELCTNEEVAAACNASSRSSWTESGKVAWMQCTVSEVCCSPACAVVGTGVNGEEEVGSLRSDVSGKKGKRRTESITERNREAGVSLLALEMVWSA